jgi:hypothetical protein
MGWETCNDFIKENYEEGRFCEGETSGGGGELHGRWHYDKNGSRLELIYNFKSETMVSAELYEKDNSGELILISKREWNKKGDEILK